MLGLVPIFPAFYVLYNLDYLFTGSSTMQSHGRRCRLYTWPTAFVLVVASVLIIIGARWIVLPRVKPGTVSVHSWFYLRKWIVGLAAEVTLETLNSLYATIYMRYWYRLLGAKIGKGSEISSNLAGRYDLVDIGKNNFLGDEVIFGDEEIRRGWMTLKRVKTGDRVFVGNDAVIAGGSDLGDGTLIGVKSKMPDSLRTGPNETWFGTPAISVPSRQKVDMGAIWTYDPPKIYVLRRAIFEGLHTSLPTAVFITFGYMTADLMSDPIDTGQLVDGARHLSLCRRRDRLIMVLISALVKWALMGAYKPVMKPMWSWWAMRTRPSPSCMAGLSAKPSLEFMRGRRSCRGFSSCTARRSVGASIWTAPT
jgi:non-ribosomal peptide synthetase-like protein